MTLKDNAKRLIQKAKRTPKTKEMSDSTDGRTWYLRDDPLEHLGEEDQFRHNCYVQILMDTVREVSPPFTVGIFGSWGVGKTSIVNDFKRSMASDDEFKSFSVVMIDIWKYEGDSLRRQFLLELQRQLVDAKTLPKDYSVEAQLYTGRTEEVQTEGRFSWRRLKEAKWLLLEVLLIVGAFLAVVSLMPISQLAQIALSAPFLTLLLYVIPRLSRIVVVQQKYSITEPALFSSEQFEKAFEQMVKDVPCAKMVIIIDNLDRCSRDRVVEVLGVVKTYLEPKGKNKCIFVIPCDDSAIKEQVKAAYGVLGRDEAKTDVEGYADEYLRKFFNTSIQITPFIETEIEPYVETLLGKIRLTEGMPDEGIKQLVQMISFVFRRNPRRIKQFLNNLSSKYLLVREREDGDEPMIKPRISDNVLFLAKVSIIETKFPETFQEFLKDDNLYGEVLQSLDTPKDMWGEAVEALLTDELRQFLISTKHVKAQNYKAFFHLKQNPHEAAIPNYNHFWDAVRSGERKTVSDLFEKGDEESNQARLDEIIVQIRTNAEKGYASYAISAASVGCAIAPNLPPTKKEQLANEIIKAIASYLDIRGKLSLLTPAEVFDLMPLASSSNSLTVRNEYISLYSSEAPADDKDRGKFQLELAQSIANNLEQFESPQLKKVRDATAGFERINPELLLVLSSTDEAKTALVAPSLLEKVIEEIDKEKIAPFANNYESTQEHAPHIEFVLRCQDLEEESASRIWAEKLCELLELAINEDDHQLGIYIHACIDESEAFLSKAESSTIDRLAHHLAICYERADAERRTDIVLTLSTLYQYCSGDQQTQIKDLIINQFVRSEPHENVARFLAAQADNKFANLTYHEEAFDSIAQRVVSEGDEDNKRQILSSYLNIDAHERKDLLARVLKSLIGRTEVSITVPLVQQFINQFPISNQGKSMVAPILDKTIHPHHGLSSAAERKPLLELSIFLKDWHTNSFRDDFDKTLVELLTSDDHTFRQLGLDILDRACDESAISHERRIKVLRDLADSLTERKPPPDDSIMQQLSLVIGVKHDVLAPGLTSGIVEYLRKLIRENPNYRQKSLSLLSSFSDLPREVLEELIPELVGYAEREGDPNIKSAFEECLLSLRRGNAPLDRGLWEDYYQYIRALIASADDAQKQRGSELSNKMRQITGEARKASEKVRERRT